MKNKLLFLRRNFQTVMQAKDKRKHFQYPFRTIPVDQGADIMWTKKKSKWRENSTKKTSPFLRRFFSSPFRLFPRPHHDLLLGLRGCFKTKCQSQGVQNENDLAEETEV